MSKESIINFVTRPCGHIDEDLLTRVNQAFDELDSEQKCHEIWGVLSNGNDRIDSKFTFEEQRASLAVRVVNFVLFYDGRGEELCSLCDQEKLESWKEATQSW